MRLNLILLLIVLMALCAASVVIALLKDHIMAANVSGVIMVVLCALLIIIFMRNIMRPIRTINNGLYLLYEQDFSSRLAPVGHRETDRIIEMFNSMMTSLKEERLKLREQNHLLDLLIEVSPMGIIMLNPADGTISHLNNAAANFLGYERREELDRCSLDALDCSLGKVIAGLRLNDSVTTRLENSSIYRCSRLAFMDNGYQHPYILIEALTDEVMLAERKSYEKIIRLIAHEVNNSMAGITSMLDTITMFDTADGSRSETEIDALISCSQRCKSLSKFITSYSDVVKIPEPTPVRTDINAFVSKLSVLLESICENYGIELRLLPTPVDVYARIDTVLFEQVLINIVKNAAESATMTQGYVSVETTSSPAGLVVTDSGAGIPADVAPRLFSPFFSTKPQGQGIGLLFVRDVLRKHACLFSLRTEPDGLTRFTIHFNDRM